ncbi:PspC domain-containing protein [Chitinophaga qingshengii]|uniref:PspC domain-containing protein n=1 Tax=Chitinophaga qingshengii TaxID=1569794 RepID=A0ABR7TNX9_9BACT|nr:PspC domain-containing protein [Chitinophaga qingshengii]MBC9931695.1 PspC domain-containing protein [Chitinophaga qingshengii]
MKKIININLASRLIPIEDSAYELLRQYLDSLKTYFSKEDGGDEIVADIESRIAELFQDKLKKGAHCITDEDVAAVKVSMGTPEQFDDAPASSGTQSQAGNEGDYYMPRPRKRLYRDPDNKVLSGVCSGLGAYFNVDPVIFRIIFALLAIGGFGTGVLVYFILWVATPSADTAAEKLEMRGEKVDLNNIKATIQEELNHMKGQMKNMGKDFQNFSQGRGKQVGNDLERFFVNLAQGLGKVLVFATKGFVYFLAVVILICLIVTGIAIAISSAALFPLKGLLLSSHSAQSYFFWPAIVLLLGIPVVALLMFIVRKLTGVKPGQGSRYAGYSLMFLWLLGLVFAGIVGSSLAKDFRRRSNLPVEAVALKQPSHNKLVLRMSPGIFNGDDFSWFDDNLIVADDTTMINLVKLRVEKSPTDSFSVDLYRFSQGRTLQQANQLAGDIHFSVKQEDSVLYIPQGFSLSPRSTYRGQRLTMVIKVPVGKNLEIEDDIYRHFSFDKYGRNYDNDDWYIGVGSDDWDNRDRNRTHTRLKMTPDGVSEETPATKENVSSDKAAKDSVEKVYKYKGNDTTNK